MHIGFVNLLVFNFVTDVITIVSQSASNYQKVLDELAVTNKMIRNLTDVIDRQKSKIDAFDQRFILSVIKIKNELILSNNRSVQYHEDVLKKVQQVKKEILDFFLSQGEVKKEREELEEHGDADIDKKGEFSDFETSQQSFLEHMTLNFKDGKLILILSMQPAPIAFVCTIVFLVIAVLLVFFFCSVWTCKKICTTDCCKRPFTPSQRLLKQVSTKTATKNEDETLKNEFEMRSSSFRFKKGSGINAPPSPPPLPPPSPTFSLDLLPLPPPPPPLQQSTPKPTPKKMIPKNEPVSLKDAIPKLKPDGTTYSPSEIISIKRKNSIPKTRPTTKIVNGEVQVVGQVHETSL
jgi:hypothetical protein